MSGMRALGATRVPSEVARKRRCRHQAGVTLTITKRGPTCISVGGNTQIT